MDYFSCIQITTDADWAVFQQSAYYPVALLDDCLAVAIETRDAIDAYWLATPFFVEKIINMEETNEKFLKIIYETKAFGWQPATISMKLLNRKDFVAVNAFGLFYRENLFSYLLSYVLTSADQAPKGIGYQRIGWKFIDDELCFRTSRCFTQPKSNINRKLYSYMGKVNLKQQITEQSYLSTLNSLLKTDGTMFAIAVGLSSALLALPTKEASLKSLIIHLFGKSTKGKTTFLKLACSCWGDPCKSPLVNSWNITQNAFDAILADNFGITVGFDEASSSFADYTRLIYCITGDHSRSKCNIDSTLKEQSEWNTTIISTAEESILAHANRNNGLKVRCFEFFNLNITNGITHAAQINTFVEKNYGFLGRQLVKYLLKLSKDKINRHIRIVKRWVGKKLGTQKCSLSDRLIGYYAILILTAYYAVKIGVNLNILSIMNILKSHHDAIVQDMISDDALPQIIKEYILTHPSNFHPVNNVSPYSICEGVYDKNYYYMLEGVFDKIIVQNHYTDKTVALEKLVDANFLNRNKDRYYFTKTINGKKVKCYKFKV